MNPELQAKVTKVPLRNCPLFVTVANRPFVGAGSVHVVVATRQIGITITHKNFLNRTIDTAQTVIVFVVVSQTKVIKFKCNLYAKLMSQICFDKQESIPAGCASTAP